MLRAQPQPGTLCAVSHGTLTPAWPIFYMQTQESLRYFPKIDQYLGSTPVGSGVYRLHQGKGNGTWPFAHFGVSPPRPGSEWGLCCKSLSSTEASPLSPPGCRYDAATTYGHDAAAAAASQWAASTPSLWSSSPMAAAAAAASTAPSAQQQYGFQYPFAMAAK